LMTNNDIGHQDLMLMATGHWRASRLLMAGSFVSLVRLSWFYVS
jgi:hypothetical protein